MWEDLIQKAKDGGLDVIDTYVFWNVHETSPGNVLQSRSSSHIKNVFFLIFFSEMFYFVLCCSTILKEGMIWHGSLRQCRKWGFMYTFGLDLMFVLSGILGMQFQLFFYVSLFLCFFFQ